MKLPLTCLLAAMASLLLTACAPVAHIAGTSSPASGADGREVDWSHGAKHGWVAGFYDAATPRAALPACLAALPADELAQHRFARIDYRHVRRMLVEVAELPPQSEVKLGDRVELWPEDCAKGKLSHISRVMAPPAA